jgi:hypothetical protein
VHGLRVLDAEGVGVDVHTDRLEAFPSGLLIAFDIEVEHPTSLVQY